MKFGRILLFLCLVSLFVIPVTVLQIRLPKEDRVVWIGRVSPGDGMETVYLHSVEKCPVFEYYRIGEDLRFSLKETVFSSCNTGLPTFAEGGERFTSDGKTFRLTGMDRVIPEIRLWVHRDYGNILKLGNDRVIDLPALAGNGLLEVAVRRMPLARWGALSLSLFLHRR